MFQVLEGFGLHHERLKRCKAIDDLINVVVNYRGHARVPFPKPIFNERTRHTLRHAPTRQSKNAQTFGWDLLACDFSSSISASVLVGKPRRHVLTHFA